MTLSNIATALAKAQMQMGKALKQSNNPHFRSKYADLGNVMDACMPALNENGIAVLQPIGTDENGDRFVDTILLHGESGEQLSCRVPLIVAKNDMQGFGSAVTYARRYGLQTMAGIAPEDDDGNAASKAPPQQQRRQSQQNDGDRVRGLEVAIAAAKKSMQGAKTIDELRNHFASLHKDVRADDSVIAFKDARKAELENDQLPIDDDLPFGEEGNQQ